MQINNMGKEEVNQSSTLISKSKPKEQKMVAVPEDDLKKMMAKIDMLTEIADKGRLSMWESKHRDFITRKVRINTFEGKVINGWRLLKDEVGKSPITGLFFEDQIIELHFLDSNKPEQMKYHVFTRQKKQIEVNIVKSTKISDENGEHNILTVDMNGQNIDIDVVFVN